jgi:predicted Fe-S protein YdhL (DUF1289 family)
MSLSKFCPVKGCQRRIPTAWAMCRPHWQLLDAAQRRKIWSLCDRRSMSQYKAAVKAAVRTVEEIDAIDTPPPSVEA